MTSLEKKSSAGIIDKSLVIHIVTSLDFGGVESHMESIAEVLGCSKFRHIFVAIGRGGKAEGVLRKRGVEVYCLEQKVTIPSLGAFVKIFKLFRKLKPLVVHTHGAEANFHGLLVALLADTQVRIGEEIGIPQHSFVAKFVFRIVYGFSHRVIGVSHAVTQWLEGSCEVPVRKLVSLYNPVSLTAGKILPSCSSSVFRIVFVGRLEPVKNPIALLHAFIIFEESIAASELWFIGEGSERHALEKIILENGLADKVRLFGYQSAPDVYVSQSNIYVQPSLSEGFGIALVEAMACGVPVISTSVGGAPEIVKPDESGWLLAEASAESICGALSSAWESGTERLKEMGENAQRSVAGHFAPVDYLASIEQLYSEVCQSGV